MMRGPRNWAVAVRKPDGQIAQVARPIDRRWRATGSFACRSPRCRRARRVARDRLSRALGLGELRGRRSEERGRLGTGRDRPLGDVRSFAVAIGFASRRSRSARGSSPTCCRSRTASGSCSSRRDPDHDLRELPRTFEPDPALKRVFEYHAAEHKVINAYEAGEELRRDGPALLAHPPALRHLVPFWVIVLSAFVYAPFGRLRLMDHRHAGAVCRRSRGSPTS